MKKSYLDQTHKYKQINNYNKRSPTHMNTTGCWQLLIAMDWSMIHPKIDWTISQHGITIQVTTFYTNFRRYEITQEAQWNVLAAGILLICVQNKYEKEAPTMFVWFALYNQQQLFENWTFVRKGPLTLAYANAKISVFQAIILKFDLEDGTFLQTHFATTETV